MFKKEKIDDLSYFVGKQEETSFLSQIQKIDEKVALYGIEIPKNIR